MGTTTRKGPSSGVARVGIVGRHELTAMGLRWLLAGEPSVAIVGAAATVTELLDSTFGVDIVALELSLDDRPGAVTEIAGLADTGVQVVAFTGERNYPTHDVAVLEAAGVLIIPLDEPDALRTEIVAATRGRRETGPVLQLVDGSQGHVELSAREREVLALYAAGEKSQRVASLTGLAVPTVKEYVDRIRAKYAQVGRPAGTKIDLFYRAVEDGILAAPRPRPRQESLAEGAEP